MRNQCRSAGVLARWNKSNKTRTHQHFDTSSRHHAFTLIEILIAIVIVAIVVAVAALSINVMGRREKVKLAADRLVEVITYAEQQSFLQLNPISLRIEPSYYQFFQYVQQSWQPMPQAIFGREDLPDGITANSSVKQVTFSQSGDVMPFVIRLQDGKRTLYSVTVSANGEAASASE